MNAPNAPMTAFPSSASNAKKRTAAGQVKYYAVKAGHVPGIYTDYKDVVKNMTGYKGAICKSCETC
jgi:ribonuclease HI